MGKGHFLVEQLSQTAFPHFLNKKMFEMVKKISETSHDHQAAAIPPFGFLRENDLGVCIRNAKVCILDSPKLISQKNLRNKKKN